MLRYSYIEFESAIPLFRNNNQEDNSIEAKKGEITSGLYILTDFKLYRNFTIEDFTISSSKQVFINSNTFANISEIIVPQWVKNSENPDYNAACFSVVLSALMSLATERNVVFHRDFYKIEGIDNIAHNLPLQYSGPGSIDKINPTNVKKLMDNLEEAYTLANNLNERDYKSFIRSCRLYQLAQQNKYTDHNLSYSLMVSSIEANATKAIKVRDVKEDWDDTKKKIKTVAREAGLAGEFRALLNTKLEQHYSGLRFQTFMLQYAPVKSLYLENRYDKMGLLPEEKKSLEPMDRRIDPVNYFIHEDRSSPNFLLEFKAYTGLDFAKILKDTYNYRSEFYHEGKAKQFNVPYNDDWYLKQYYVRETNVHVTKKDFDHLPLDTNELWALLLKEDFVIRDGGKFLFDKSKLMEIDREAFDGQAGEIQQIYLRKEHRQIYMASFNLLSLIGRLSAINYYKSLQP